MKNYRIMVLALALAFAACATGQKQDEASAAAGEAGAAGAGGAGAAAAAPSVPVTIKARARQVFTYDGKPKTVVFSVDQDVVPVVSYYRAASVTRGLPINKPPVQRGVYLILISYPGDARYKGASKEIELVIK